MSLILLLALACIPFEDRVEKLILSVESTLPDLLAENSGMTEIGSLFWLINDSGNEPALYGYDKDSNKVTATIMVDGAVNTDWEEITQNEEYVFIGDFGNNAGARKDLRIYRISKTDLEAATGHVALSGVIQFTYADQTDFTEAVENTPYDCEAFIATPDSIYLFTKDWVTFHTRVYALSAQPGTQVARPRASWNADGLITASAWSPEKNTLLLLGYTPFVPFIWEYTGFDPEKMTFSENKRTDFADFWATQTEGILFSTDGSVYISSEALQSGEMTKPATLFRLSTGY
jgi:hypothetical protein